MSINVPIVKINTPNSIQSTVVSNELKSKKYSQNPSFGFKPIKDEHWLNRLNRWFDENFDSTWQRAVAGGTAIFTQPFIDYKNKKTDEDTRITSCARTIAKIIVGTATGVAIRWGCIKFIGRYTQNKDVEQHRYDAQKAKYERQNKSIDSIPLPRTTFTTREQRLLSEDAKRASYREIKKYRGAVGTFAALAIMIFTNFLVDAPLTMYFTNKINPKLKQILKGKSQNTEQGVNQ